MRGAVRDILSLVNVSDMRSSFGVRYNASGLRPLFDATEEAMRHGSMCFVPSGDTPTSRRLFEAMATGCVPIITRSQHLWMASLPFRTCCEFTPRCRSAGRGRSQQITADHSRPQQITAAHSRSQPTNAFTRAQLSGVSRSVCVLVVHRTYPTPDVSHPLVSHPRALVLCAAVTIVEWRAFSYFLSPTRMSLAHRHKQPSSTSDVWEGRRVEAAWVEAQVWETRQVHHARKMALAAFCAHMDPQANPVGMLDAVLSYQHFL